MNTPLGRLLSGIALSLIFLSIIVYAFLVRRPLCIDSKIVERIDRGAGHNFSSMYRCAIRKTVPYDEALDELQVEWSPRLQEVERFLEGVEPLQQKISISILDKKTHFFKILGHDLLISDDLKNSDGLLEKAILKIWFHEKASNSVLDHPLVEESVTDLLQFIMHGNLASGLSVRGAKWPFVVKTVGTYCQSDWRQMEYEQYCKDVEHQDGVGGGALVASSLRPLLTESFISAYMELDLRQKKSFLDSLPRALREMDFYESGVGFSATEENKQSLVDLSAELSGILRNLAKSNENGITRWQKLVSENLADRGFVEQTLTARADLLIKLHGVTSADFFANGKIVIGDKSTAILVDEKQFFLLPSHEGIAKSIIGPILAQRILYLYCGAVQVADLLAMQNIGSNLLAVEACEGKTTVHIEPYLQGHAEEFAQRNLDLRFVDIHLPSLAWAAKNNRLTSSQNLSLAENTRAIFQKQLGWRKSTFDESSKFFTIEGEIDAIRSYRP